MTSPSFTTTAKTLMTTTAPTVSHWLTIVENAGQSEKNKRRNATNRKNDSTDSELREVAGAV